MPTSYELATIDTAFAPAAEDFSPPQEGYSSVFQDIDPYHQLNIGAHTSSYHRWLMDELVAENLTSEAMQTLVEAGDTNTWNHCFRVGYLMVGAALHLEMSAAETALAGRIGLNHDIGKSHPKVQGAIHSPEVIPDDATEASRNTLFTEIRRHPRYGVKIAREVGLDRNVQMGIGLHHAMHPTRPYSAYSRRPVPRPARFLDGTRPDMDMIVSLAACADTYDALTAEKALARRSYQARKIPTPLSRDEVAHEINRLNVSPEAKAAIMSITAI